MKYCVIDTETSGLFDFTKPADAEGQPRLACLAMIHLGEDLAETSREEHWIKPDGWTLSPEVIATHGITNEFLAENGRPVAAALEAYDEVLASGSIIVAFNAQYDLKMMRGELRRAAMPDHFEETKSICVMRDAVNVVKAPKKSGKGFKFPKLEEACRHFGIGQSQAHSAMSDAESAAAIFRALNALGVLREPAVYLARVKPDAHREG